MLAKVFSYGLCGLDVYPVTIEVDVAAGLPATIIVGLPDSAVKESKERVRAAVKNSGYRYDARRVTVNLSPADIKKEGPSFDLPAALGVLAASGQIDPGPLRHYAVLGELSLDGRVRPVSGVLPMAMKVPPGRFRGLIVPADNAAEAAVTGRIAVHPARSLTDVIRFLQEPETIPPVAMDVRHLLRERSGYPVDFAEVRGQGHVKRGLEVAAAGGHNVVLIGPPGSGKSMMAKRIPTILPDMTLPEALETTRIHSIVGLVPPGSGLIGARPFRSPHHTSSNIALVGGGSVPRPGEVSLSHNGVLFLDELPEFNRSVLEALRQPLEDRTVTVSRAARTTRFPSKFMLVASMNPCPCGYFTDQRRSCHCSAGQIQRYLSRISGPLLDRIDIHLEVPSLPPGNLFASSPAEASAAIKKRTVLARERQLKRFGDPAAAAVFANAQMEQRQIRAFCRLTGEAQTLLEKAMDELGLSARAHDKILKVARTIADLDGADAIEDAHLAEAIQYRYLDRNWWG